MVKGDRRTISAPMYREMNEEYYEALPDIQAYLDRIGVRMREPSVDYLDELVYAHQCTVPFENLDVYEYRRAVSLETGKLFDKIVTRGRGGYCFELNGLFVALLCALGFDAWSCPCRITRDENARRSQIMHRGNIVRVDGELYFCDVGFGGPMAPFAVPFNGEKKTVHGETFWFSQTDEWWWMLRRITRGKGDVSSIGVDPEKREQCVPAPVMLVSPTSWEPTDFIELNRACSEGPGARFARTRMVNMRRPDGYCAISENRLTLVENGNRTERELGQDEVAPALLQYFNLADR